MSWPSSSALGPLFATEAMAAVFSDCGRIQAMLDAEAALARAQAACGVIPAEAAEAIAQAAKAELYDVEGLARHSVASGNLAVPLVKALTAKVGERHPDAARWAHWGSTSQDIIDTGLALQIRAGLRLIEADLAALGDALAALAEAYAETPLAGRTLMQHAVPVTFGLKAAGWLAGIAGSADRLAQAGRAACVLQCGGAAGTLAAMGDRGLDVAQAMAVDLGLALPDLPWPAERGRIADLGCALALVVGALGKLARDLALMAQTEVGEYSEPSGDGRGGSSAMPHKANPVGCARILAAARRVPPLAATLLAAMDQEHERGLGGWQAEWEALPDLFRLAGMAASVALDLIASGRFHTERMRANLGATSGLIMAEAVSAALAAHIGRSAAQQAVARAARRARAEGVAFAAALSTERDVASHLGPDRLQNLLEPSHYPGAAGEFVRRALRSYRARRRGEDSPGRP
jgi:3-carboxy-cis,cis-muconate cycloisomerase